MVPKKIFVKKMNGNLEEYDESKLERSLIRVGADKKVIKKVMNRVSRILYDGIETKRLFKFVFDELRKLEDSADLRYNLKNAIINLRIAGGFVFEKFVGRLFEKKGYEVSLNNIVQGKLVTHEVDITAKKGKEVLMIETKHHNSPWLGEKIQTALYVYARFLDLNKKYTRPFLVTNTKFSSQVRRYAKGMNVGVMGWNYPKGNGLSENIDKYKLYPITVLNLTKPELHKYFEKGILTLDDLKNVKGVSKSLIKKIDAISLD
jgi:hypothetical protein